MSSPDKRLASLDGLRAISIVLVLIGHLAGTHGSPTWLLAFHNVGNIGVKFFFVLSGFLITSLLLRELDQTGRIALGAFYLRRAIRIFPAFYAFVLIVGLLDFLGIFALKPNDLFHAATYTMNYHHDRAWQLNHTWSLAVEEQFYLLWPFLLLRLGPQHALKALLACLLLAPLLRFGMLGLGASDSAMTREFQAVADSLAIGCVAAFIYAKEHKTPYLRLIRSPWGLAAALLALGAGTGSFLIAKSYYYVAGQSLVNLGAGIIILRYAGIEKGPIATLLNTKPFIVMGTLSYSLYLWQELFLDSYQSQIWTAYPLNLCLVFVAAWISYRFIEKPFLNLRRHIPLLRADASTNGLGSSSALLNLRQPAE